MIAFLFAAPFLGQDAQTAGQDSGIVVEGERAKPAKKVCKRTIPTGSVMPKVTCRAAAEWETARERDLAGMEQMRGEARTRQAVQLERMLSGN